MVVGTQASATTRDEVVTATTSKMPVCSGNHGNDWTIWEMKMSALLTEKELDAAVPIRPHVDREASHIHDWVCTLA
jgi:hypothetical protein